MVMAYRSHAATSGTDATAEGSLPAGVTQDDYLIAFFMHSSLGADVTTAPSGWTDIGADPATGDFSLKAYGRVYQSGDSAPTVEWDVAGNWAVDIVAYSGVDTTTPISGSGSGVSAGTVSSLDIGPATPGVNDCLLVAFCNADVTGAARTYSTATMTERVGESTNEHSHTVQDEQLSGGSGTPVTRTVTISGTAQHLAGYIYALAPAAAGGVDAEVLAVAATATAAANIPNIKGAAKVNGMNPATVSVSAGIPTVTTTAGGDASVIAVTATASAAAPAPTVAGSSVVNAVVATATAAALAPNIKGAAKVNGMSPATATVSAPAPSVTIGNGSATVDLTPVAEPTGTLKIIGASSEFGGWEALQAGIGTPIARARRAYPILVASGMNKSADIEEIIADGGMPVISYKPPTLTGQTSPDTAGFLAGDYDAYLTATKDYLVSLGVPLTVSFWHEPRNEISATDFIAGWEKFFTEFAGTGPNISLGPILNGFLLDNVSGTTEFEAFIPDTHLDRWDFVAVDTYQTGTNETPGSKLPGRAVPLLATLLDNRGYPDMPIGVGEYNGLTASAVTYAGEIFLSTPEVWFACSWSGIANSTGLDWVLDDDRLEAFKATLADPRAYPGQTATARVSAVAPTVVTETSITVTVATATLTMNSPTVSAFIPLHFTPPTYERPIRSAVRPLNYYRQTFSQSVVRVNGSFRLVSQPTADQLEAAGEAGVDYFIGGHIYEVTAETAAELTAAGYTIT